MHSQNISVAGDHVTRIVKQDKDGELYVSCGQGFHSLDGQLDRAGKNYVGFWIAPSAGSSALRDGMTKPGRRSPRPRAYRKRKRAMSE